MKHILHHLVGCGLPILLLFLLPVFGVSSGVTFTLFFVLMFGAHFFMMGGHDGHQHETDDDRTEPELRERRRR